MEFNSCISQHAVSPTSLPRSFRSSALLPQPQRTSIQRPKFAFVCKTVATTQTHGAHGGKSNFVEPKWLLPVQGENHNNTENELSNSSFYQVILTTSQDYDSGISDPNADILLTFIGEAGNCILYQISNSFSPRAPKRSKDFQESCESGHSLYRFERGAKDVVTFLGPDLGRLEAVWVAPQRGTWRVQGITVRVFPEALHLEDGTSTGSNGFKSFQYDFHWEEVLIGEYECTSAAELLVTSVQEISDEERHADEIKLASQSQKSLIQLRDEGLKEYEALKLSLLGYDALLIIVGGAILVIVGHKEVTEGYLIGGISGFLYLFFLGKAVDQLPAPSNPTLMFSNRETSEGETSSENKSDLLSSTTRGSLKYYQTFSRFKAPLTKLAGVLIICLVILKVANVTDLHAITKEMLFGGVAGFLITKLATVLASNIPLSLRKAHSSQEEG